MTELQKIQQYLTSLKFYIDYQYENEQIWASSHIGADIFIDTDTTTVSISRAFVDDVVVTTLEGVKKELE